jgi:hypothetical protein
MMEALVMLGRALGFSFAAGINLYATVAVLGLASRYGWVAMPAEFRIFDNDWVIGLALLLYLVEFFADKIPWVDTLWDALHSLVRPLGGALIAVTTLGEASPAAQGMVALLGGTVAASSHLAKAGTRVAVNSSPEPFSNWVLSFVEDVFVVGLGFFTMKFPVLALIVCLVLLALIVFFMAALVRAVRRRFRPRAPAPA